MQAARMFLPGMMVVALMAGCGGSGSAPKSPPGGATMVALKVPGMT